MVVNSASRVGVGNSPPCPIQRIRTNHLTPAPKKPPSKAPLNLTSSPTRPNPCKSITLHLQIIFAVPCRIETSAPPGAIPRDNTTMTEPIQPAQSALRKPGPLTGKRNPPLSFAEAMKLSPVNSRAEA